MSPEQRETWLLQWFADQGELGSADILNSDFVEAYVQATGATSSIQFYGAARCPQLGRDLAWLYRRGLLRRSTIGLPGDSGMGFPKWVYSYRLSPKR